MKRVRRALLGTGLLGVLGAVAGLWWPRPAEPFPLAELVPADAVFYAGFPDYRELEALRTPWAAEIRQRLDPVRAHLAGPVCVYLDRALEWVALARLTRASAVLAGADVENGAAAVAQSPGALARHKTRESSLADLAEFRSLGLRFFVNLRALRIRGRLHDFASLGFDLVPPSKASSGDPKEPPFEFRGRALYRGGVMSTYLERYVQAPLHGCPRGAAPFQAVLSEHFPRLWDEITHEWLDAVDAEKVEREAGSLSRYFLHGKSFREFLGRLGPAWGFSVVPTSRARPALVVWIELPDEETRNLAVEIVHRAINDAIKLRRDRGLAPLFETVADGPIWRIRWADARALRQGESFTPAYTFQKNRFILSTCAEALATPEVPAGDLHLAATVELGPLFEALGGLAPDLADDAFRTEAERQSASLLQRTFTPGVLTALRRQFPDPADLTAYQEAEKARLEARALEEASKTPAGQKELTRVKAEIAAWAERLGWLERLSFTGRFSGEGLVFELSAWPKPGPTSAR